MTKQFWDPGLPSVGPTTESIGELGGTKDALYIDMKEKGQVLVLTV